MFRDLLGIFSIFVIGVFVILLIGHLYSDYVCSNYEVITGIETKHVVMDTCYLNTENGWQRYDEYIARVTTKDSLNSL